MYGMALIEAFNNAQLQNLSFAAGAGNTDYKANLLMSYVFQHASLL